MINLVATILTVMPLFLFLSRSVLAVKDFETLRHLRPQKSANEQTEAAQQLFNRVLGERASQFQAYVLPGLGPDEKDSFNIKTVGNTVNVTGTTGVAVAMGLYFYLTNHCGCQITWGGQQMNIPKDLPKIPTPGITIIANDRFRYFSNVCTPSYSFVWYQWSDWEKLIDWMALHGINMPLTFTGQEAIFQRVYMKLNFTTYDLQRHFGGPAFLAWSRMGNMHGWGGPMQQSWINGQLALQHKILDRVRSLGMTSVLPGFAGHVPEAITWLYPKANISRLPDWADFNYTYCCNLLLDFDDPLFKQIGKMFIQELIQEFGTDHIYSIDTFNEMEPKSSDPGYLSKSSRVIYEIITEADPLGIWLMQGWLFQDVGFWRPAQIQALLSGVPQGKMIVLDLFSEIAPIFTRTESYYGQPFIWCMLHNFGGTSELYGALININNGPFDGRAFPNSTMIGIGMTPEGIYQNEVIYEFFAENTWRNEPRDIGEWIANYTVRRYGKNDKGGDYVSLAWQYLKRSVYNNSDKLRDHNHNGIPVTRPKLAPTLRPDKSVYNNTDRLHDNNIDIIPTSRPQVKPMLHPDTDRLHSTAIVEGNPSDLSFDVSNRDVQQVEPIVEESIVDDPPRPEPVAADDSIVFTVNENGTKQGKKLLSDSRGFTYNVKVWYDPEDLFIAWDILQLSSDRYVNNSLYLYDLVDVTRNSLQIISLKVYQDLINAFLNSRLGDVTTSGNTLLGLLKDMDILLGSDPHFLMGKWIESAKAVATTPQESAIYEFNARNQVTLWGPRGEILDYACKQWSGLIEGYYRPRWQLFVNTLENCLKTETNFSQDNFNQQVLKSVEQPFSYDKTKLPSTPSGDTIAIVKDIHKRYRPETRSSYFRQLGHKAAVKKDARDWIERKYAQPIVKKFRNPTHISRFSFKKNYL